MCLQRGKGGKGGKPPAPSHLSRGQYPLVLPLIRVSHFVGASSSPRILSSSRIPPSLRKALDLAKVHVSPLVDVDGHTELLALALLTLILEVRVGGANVPQSTLSIGVQVI